MSICSSVTCTASGPVMLAGIHTDQNWPPMRPARRRGMSVIRPGSPGAVRPVGAAGAVAGVAGVAEALAEAALSPTALVALTVKV